ncbi:MAG TPA: DUF2017 family protein [Actinomycetota bacterium]|nr:DUF2017 family protein [Actinomycetota bacterium]
MDRAEIQLDQREAGILRGLIEEMRALLSPGSVALARDQPAPDPVLERLFPDASPDPDAALEFTRLVGAELHAHKLQVLSRASELLGERGPVRLELEGEDLTSWLTLLTDLRLAIGTRLGVDEAAMEADLDRDDPKAGAMSVVHWLGWVQERTLRQVTG